MNPTKPPVKNAMYKARIVPGNPKMSPITKANLTSPKPIPLALVIE